MPNNTLPQLCGEIVSQIEENPFALLALEDRLTEKFASLCNKKNVKGVFVINDEEFPVALVASFTPKMWDKFASCGGSFPSSSQQLHAMWNKRFHLWSCIDLQCRFIEAIDMEASGGNGLKMLPERGLKTLRGQQAKNNELFCHFVALGLQEGVSTLKTLKLLIQCPSITSVSPVLEYLVKNKLLNPNQTLEFLNTHKNRLHSDILENYLTQHALEATLAPVLGKTSLSPLSKKM